MYNVYGKRQGKGEGWVRLRAGGKGRDEAGRGVG